MLWPIFFVQENTINLLVLQGCASCKKESDFFTGWEESFKVFLKDKVLLFKFELNNVTYKCLYISGGKESNLLI